MSHFAFLAAERDLPRWLAFFLVFALWGHDPGAAPRPRPPGPAGYRLAWTTDVPAEIDGIAVAPSGDVLSYGGGKMDLRARDTGKILESGRLSWALDNAFGFLDDSRGVMICREEIIEVRFPGLLTRKVFTFQKTQWKGAVGRRRVAVTGGAEVQVIDTSRWVVIDRFQTDRTVDSLAFSPDEETLVFGIGSHNGTSGKHGRIWARDLATASTRALLTDSQSQVLDLSVSPDGSEVFANIDFDFVQVIPLRPARPGRSTVYPAKFGFDHGRYLGPGLVSIAGSDGLFLFSKKGAPLRLSTANSRALGASADGALVCSGGSKHLSCFTARPIPPSEYRPATGPPPLAELRGSLLSREDDRLRMSPGVAPAAVLQAQTGRIFAYLKEPGAAKGFWFSVGDVELIERGEQQLVLRLTRVSEDNRIEMEGDADLRRIQQSVALMKAKHKRPVDAIAPGARIKVNWGE